MNLPVSGDGWSSILKTHAILLPVGTSGVQNLLLPTYHRTTKPPTISLICQVSSSYKPFTYEASVTTHQRPRKLRLLRSRKHLFIHAGIKAVKHDVGESRNYEEKK